MFESSGSGNSFLVQKIKEADQDFVVSVNENAAPALLLALDNCKSDEVIFSLLERGAMQKNIQVLGGTALNTASLRGYGFHVIQALIDECIDFRDECFDKQLLRL